MTSPDDKAPSYGTIGEIEHALFAKAITLHTKIKARWETIDAGGNPVRQVVVATPGRMMIAQILPKHPDVPFDLINRQLTKKNVSDVIDAVYRHCGQKECVIFADRLMGLGFGQAAKAGISFGKDDLIIPVREAGDDPQDTGRGEGVRATVPGRPDHRGRALQQGGRCLVALHR